MLTVACVLRSGGDYRVEHVVALKNGVGRFLKAPHRFVCLTDVSVPCDKIKLLHNWTGWWSKLELFRPGLFGGKVLYFDLDTVIVGPLDDIARIEDGQFTVLKNFWGKTGAIGSGMMAWDTALGMPTPFGMGTIYHKFLMAPTTYRAEYSTAHKWGDQGFIRDYSPRKWDFWQERHPNKVVSYKAHCRKGPMSMQTDGPAHVPQGSSVICYHGKPRPWETQLGRRYMEM